MFKYTLHSIYKLRDWILYIYNIYIYLLYVYIILDPPLNTYIGALIYVLKYIFNN